MQVLHGIIHILHFETVKDAALKPDGGGYLFLVVVVVVVLELILILVARNISA